MRSKVSLRMVCDTFMARANKRAIHTTKRRVCRVADGLSVVWNATTLSSHGSVDVVGNDGRYVSYVAFF